MQRQNVENIHVKSLIPSKTNIDYLLRIVFDNCLLYLLLVVTIAHADEIYYFVESPSEIKVALQIVVVTVASCRHDPLQEINEAKSGWLS